MSERHDLDLNISFWDTPSRGADTFIVCYNDATEWTYIDSEDNLSTGRVPGEWVSYDEQLLAMKVRMVRIIGHDVQDSRLHAANHRGDRLDW